MLAGTTPLAVVSTTYFAWSLAELGEFAEATRRTAEVAAGPKRARTRSL
jgi:hypothetical protein